MNIVIATKIRLIAESIPTVMFPIVLYVLLYAVVVVAPGATGTS